MNLAMPKVNIPLIIYKEDSVEYLNFHLHRLAYQRRKALEGCFVLDWCHQKMCEPAILLHILMVTDVNPISFQVNIRRIQCVWQADSFGW